MQESLAQSIQEVESRREVVALSIASFSLDEIQRVIDHMAKIPSSPHFESNSFLFRPEDAREVLRRFGGEDVTDVYQELEAREQGFRIVRVGRQFEDSERLEINKSMVIKDYATEIFFVYDEYGKPQGIIPKREGPGVFSSSRFVTVVERPLRFFDSAGEAVAHRLAQLEQAA